MMMVNKMVFRSYEYKSVYKYIQYVNAVLSKCISVLPLCGCGYYYNEIVYL